MTPRCRQLHPNDCRRPCSCSASKSHSASVSCALCSSACIMVVKKGTGCAFHRVRSQIRRRPAAKTQRALNGLNQPKHTQTAPYSRRACLFGRHQHDATHQLCAVSQDVHNSVAMCVGGDYAQHCIEERVVKFCLRRSRRRSSMRWRSLATSPFKSRIRSVSPQLPRLHGF